MPFTVEQADMAARNIVIIDYGSGNLHSISKAFEKSALSLSCASDAEYRITVSSCPKDVHAADAVVLPGVGAFKDCIDGLNKINGLRSSIEKKVIQEKKPFLGICVGMQMLAARSYEYGVHEGLGWIDADIIPFTPGPNTPVPHMGWNEAVICGTHNIVSSAESSDMYFVHSYYMYLRDRGYLQATCRYAGVDFPALIAKDNICAAQFHPEKSHHNGLKMLKTFLSSIEE